MKTNQKQEETELKGLDINAIELGIGGNLASEKEEEAYRLRMKKRMEVQQKRLEKRNKEKGLILVFTGHGKGKTTAALGIALRTLGHDQSVAVIQFIKGGWEPGEVKALKSFGKLLSWHSLGEGFTWETQNRHRDEELVSLAWQKSLVYLRSKEYKLVILDEINIALKLGYISIENVLKGIKERPPFTHVVLTGRNAPEELIENADLVTEMTLIHHPFKEQGVKAQAGIEF